MFSRELIYVAVYVYTLLADIKVTTSSKATPHYGYVNGQQANVCRPTPTIVQYPTGSPLQCPQNWQGTCDPRATNQPYSHLSSATTTHEAFLNDPNRGFYNDPKSSSHNNPHRIFPNKHAHNPYSSGTDPSRHHSVVGYPGYLVYQNVPKNAHNPASGCSGAEDPQWDPEDPGWDPEDPGWDPEDPGWDPEDPGWDPEDPGWDPEGDPNDPDDSDSSVTDMFSRMAQQVMSLGQNPAMGQLGNVLTNNNPLSGITADPNIGSFASTAGNTVSQVPGISADPGVTSFANTAGDAAQGVGADAGITDFLAPPNSIIPTNPDITGSASNTPQVLADANPGVTSFASTADDAAQGVGADAGITDFLAPPNSIITTNPDITGSASDTPQMLADVGEFEADQGNVLSTQQGEASTQLLETPSSTTDSEQDIREFDAIEGNTLSQPSASGDDLTPDSPNMIASQEEDHKPAQQDDTTKSDFAFILFVDNDNKLDGRNFDVTSGNIITPLLEIEDKDQDSKSNSLQLINFGDSDGGDTTQLLRFISPLATNKLLNNNNAGLCQKNSLSHCVNPSGYSSKNSQKINQRVPLQILFKSNMSQGGVKIPNNLAKNANYIKCHNTASRDASICKAISDSAKIFNRTQNINLNPFLVLTPKNLTRSSLYETNIETYITSEEMEALYEEAVSTDKSVKVLFLPDIELSEEQIQNIVERISLDISKEDGRNCQELVLIPLDLLKNQITTPSSITPVSTAVEESECENTWSLPLYSDSEEIHYQQEPPKNTFSSTSSDFETTTEVNNLPTSTSQTCQTLTTETDFCNPILPIDIPPYPEMTTPCPTLSSDNLSDSNFSSSGASAVDESMVKVDQNQELAKEEQNCSTQLKNKNHHQTEIFIPCFISIGHENHALEKKICEMQQNGCITKFLPQQYLFKSHDHGIQINSGGTISSNSECPLPLSPCSKEETVNPILSGSPYQTCASTTVEPMNYIALSGSSKINSPQNIWDSVHFEEEVSVSNKEKSSDIEITIHPHKNNSESSPTPQNCAADQTSDDSQSSSSFNVITYPITIDSELKPILPPCTSEEGAWNPGKDDMGKYEVAKERTVIDQYGTAKSNNDETRISNEYCHNQRPNARKTSINTYQIEYPVTSINSLDLLKKKTKDDYNNAVERDYNSHPEKGITILDSIKKNAQINEFTDTAGKRSGLTEESKHTCSSSNIESPLTQTTQEYGMDHSWESNKVDSCSSRGGINDDQGQSSDNRLSSSYNIVTPPENILNLTKNQDQPKCIPEIKPEVPKCPSSRVFVVKIDNIKPNNGSCPCSSFNSLVDTVCSQENIKNTHSKDHSCLCKLLSINKQKISQSEDTKPDLIQNKTCTSSAYPPNPQEIPGYDMIPTDECRKSDEFIPPLEIPQTSPVCDTYHSTNNSTKCDKNINTNTEINTSSKSPINRDCPCDWGNLIKQQRDESQKVEEYAQKTYINTVPLSPVCQEKELPKVCPPSDKNTIGIPIQEPVIQTITAAHNIPVPEICPPTEKPIYKPTVQTPPILQSIYHKNLQTHQKVPSPDICPPTVGYTETSGITFNKPAAQKPPMLQPVLNITRNLQAPQTISSPDICPPTVEYKKTSEIPIIKPTAETVPTPPRIPHICPPSHEHGKTNFEPIIQTHPMNHKITKPAICPPTNEYTKKTEIPPVSKSTAQTIPTQQNICVPVTEDCPPSYSQRTNGITFVKPTTQDLPTPQKIDTCPPSTVQYKNTSEIPIIKPIVQTCPPLQGYSKTTLTPTIQTLPMDCRIPKTQICPSTDENTKKTEIPVFKSAAQTIPTQQEICVPMDCHFYLHNKTNEIPFVKPTTKNLPTPQKIPVPDICPPQKIPVPNICQPQKIPVPNICQPQKIPVPNICQPQKMPVPNIFPSNEEPVNTDETEPEPIAQTQDWGKNIVENQTKVENVSQIIEIPKVSLNEKCLCRLKAVLEKQIIPSGQTGRNVDEIKQKPFGITTFPTPQHDPILTNCVSTDEQPRTNEVIPQSTINFPNPQHYPTQTNCVPTDEQPRTNQIIPQSTMNFPNPQHYPIQTNCVHTDEQPRTNEVIPQSVSQTKDWNNYNSQVNDGSCRGDMKPTTEMDCEECRKRRKELLAKILKEVFVNNVDLFYDEKKPCKPCSGQI